MHGSHELVIIGGGPAGLSAGLYAARARIDTVLIEKAIPGGQLASAGIVENYPGFPEGISGMELGRLMQEQAAKYGLNIISAEVQGLELSGEDKIVKTGDGEYRAKAVLIAGGSERKKLGVPGEGELLGKGLSYCAICDGPLFRDQVVAVVGGGDAALTEALSLSRFVAKVIVIHRRSQLRATEILQERAFAQPRIEFLWDTVVESIEGPDRLTGLRLRNVNTGKVSSLAVSGVFVAVGHEPNTSYLVGLLALASGGFIPVNELMETEVPGVFAAGDIRLGSARQAITAAGDGATAVLSAERYLGR